MKKELFLIIASTVSIFHIGHSQNYRELMEKSEREKEKSTFNFEENKQFETFSNDYASYIHAKAWNYRAQTIFTNPANPSILIGGRYNDMLVDKTNNIGLAAPNGGGLWSFDPNTVSGFKSIDDFAPFMPASCLEQNPFNKNEILLGTGAYDNVSINGFGLFRSTNGGKNFTKVVSTDPISNADFAKIYEIKYSPVTANTIYLATRKTLYRSIDNGSTWEKVLIGGGGYNNIITSLDFNSGTGVSVTYSNTGVYFSTNGNNNSFTLLTNGLPNNINGTSTGAMGEIRGCEIAAYPGNRNILFAYFSLSNPDKTVNGGYGEFYLYKSTNGGSSWTKISSTFPTLWVTSEDITLNLAIQPNNPNNIILASGAWGYSTDGGITWTAGELGEVDFHFANFDSSNPNLVWLGYDQGLMSANFSATGTYNGKTQIEQKEYARDGKVVTSQVHNVDFYPQSYGDAFLMGQQDGGAFVSYPTDKQPRWRVTVGDAFSCFVNKQNPNAVWTSMQYNVVNNTTTKGTNLYQGDFATTSAATYDNSIWFTHFDGNNADGNMLFFPSTSNLRRTKDNGSTYTNLLTYSGRTWNKLAIQNAADPVVYLAGKTNSGSNIIRIPNAGTASANPTTTTISNVFTNSNTAPDRITIDPNNVNTIYITSLSGEAKRITNANTATPIITDIKGNIPNVVFNVVLAPKSFPNYLIAGTNVGLFFSTDNGATWELSYEVPSTQINDMKLRESDNRLFISTYGRGVWIVTVGSITTSVDEAQNIEFSLFPNPTSSTLNIKSNFTKDSYLVIYNVLGEEVLETSTKNSIDITALSAGTYIAHLKNSNGQLLGTQKVVVNK